LDRRLVVKTVMKSITVAILGSFLFGVPCLAEVRSDLPDRQAGVRRDSEPVRKLRALYLAQPDFRKTMDEAFAGLQAQPDGSPNPWQGKKFDDLCDFFNEWYALLPVNRSPTADEFVYITRFSWFYYRNRAAQTIIGKEPGLSWTREFVEARGRFMDSRESTQSISQWLADPEIQIEQYIIPENGFQSFNQFFTRELKPGTRSIAGATDDAVLVAPTDCVLNMIEPLTPDTRIKTKPQQALNVKDLLNGSEYARFFETGTAMSCILLPSTYHHYHAAVSGEVVESKEDVGGNYWGNPDFYAFLSGGNFGYGFSYSIFERFRRGYFVIRTREFGHVAMVPVGLDTIGSVIFEEKFRNVKPGQHVPVYKGEKLGHFAYGGSLVILLFEKDVVSGIKVLQGQQIGIMERKKEK
jgi:phosphatidylserine decarboxylase